MSGIIDANGRPLSTAPSPEVQLVSELPSWCHGVGYRADDDIITVRIIVPESAMARAHVLALEAEPVQLRALVDALSACLSRSEKTMQVLDVPSTPASE